MNLIALIDEQDLDIMAIVKTKYTYEQGKR